MEKLVGYAVVGLGVGKAHVRGAIAAQGCKLVAICDIRPEQLENAQKTIPGAQEALTYTDYAEMLKNPDIDVVSVCTPSGLHADMAVQALRAGKNVLVEKPMDITVDKILEIEKARQETGLKVGGIFQNRRNAIMEPFKKAIDEGRLGEIYAAFFRVNWHRDDAYFLQNGGWRGTWAMDGGGSLMNQGVHTVDLMQWLLGDVESVKSHMRVVNHKIETEDFTQSTIKFKSGTVATFISTTSAYPGLGTELQVTGTDGSIHIDGDKVIAWKLKGDNMAEEEAEMKEKFGGKNASVSADPTVVRGHSYQIQDMVDALRFGRDPMVGPMEATKAVRIINAVYESARTGAEIVF
ncbi:MAG: Gfo/Idh/MocA family oxidoreductase [Firmicutes bacterium]|nr:Gfo/Idh/MocA family oxidoreductase [Bacillota bacterium]